MKILAYYTCFFGGENNYSYMIPDVPSRTADCYYFTNNKMLYDALEKTKYIRIFMEYIPIYNDMLKDTYSSKELKACPHRFPMLKDYMYLCWHDSKLNVIEDIVIKNMFILDSSYNKLFMLTKHPYSDTHTSVWDEYKLCINTKKYLLEMDKYKKYIETKLQNGYSDKNTIFYCCGWKLIKQCDRAKEIGELWFKEIQECGIEDQISFQFIVQKYGDYIHPLEYQETWKYCFE
jgi:hypothetical protein